MENPKMAHIYKKAEGLGFKIYPYQKERYNRTKDEHIMQNVEMMADVDFKAYLEALYNIHNENAGGWDGWNGAIKVFERLGFERKEVRQGHRVFVSVASIPPLLHPLGERR